MTVRYISKHLLESFSLLSLFLFREGQKCPGKAINYFIGGNRHLLTRTINKVLIRIFNKEYEIASQKQGIVIIIAAKAYINPVIAYCKNGCTENRNAPRV